MPPGHSEVGAPTPQQIDKRAAAKEVIDILMEIATLLVRVTSSPPLYTAGSLRNTCEKTPARLGGGFQRCEC
jgi:hypothetical protein